jgi:transcriptional regulator with PAS, ATPase and Fis domain
MYREMEARHMEDKIIGEDKAFRAEIKKAMRAALTDSPVIITGETGTGKDLLARHIHAWSKRKDKPFEHLNCAAIPQSLIESEIFGYERGAFTGASSRKIGMIELADGGTLFLNEISSLSPSAQTKLLRFMDEFEFLSVGGVETVRVDVRVIAATNSDLGVMMDEGIFRKDLYYRLNVIEIHLPPLRDRGDDVILLARYFLEKASVSQGVDRKRLTSEAESELLAHRWDGNVRELRNLMERLVVLCEEEVITKDLLLRHMELRERRKIEIRFSEILTLDEVEREYARLVLERMEGKKKPAARAMGISRDKLRRLLEKRDPDPEGGLK